MFLVAVSVSLLMKFQFKIAIFYFFGYFVLLFSCDTFLEYKSITEQIFCKYLLPGLPCIRVCTSVCGHHSWVFWLCAQICRIGFVIS